ncbi:tetratricopeptide repeat protein [Streptomyces sp. NPDC056479]|uniref:tetratricopeptide repeat protein n=1 Tax=Streptomyces sp. NPDC056479 TaxID=3345832 RepID=UPI003673658F
MPLVGRAPGVLRDRDELREVLGAAAAGPGGEVHVLHGLGGCGKTALAYWLFSETVRDHGRVGFWVNASERMSLRAGMLAVAGDRGAAAGELAAAAAGQRAAADLAWHHLDHSADPWLLVLDNADDPSILEDGAWLRISPRGIVLVTTRHATTHLWRQPGMTRHGIGVLPLDDAAQVLCDLAPDAGDLRSARKVAARLGRLPLALTLAGSHLAHQLLESWTMDEYDRKLDEASTGLVDRGATGYGRGESRHLVSRTWQLSLDTLAANGLPQATPLLRLLSYWAADPVPLSLLAGAARGQVELDGPQTGLQADSLEPALMGLLDHSLAEIVEARGVRCVQVHGVLLDSVAAGVPEAQATALAEAAADLLEAALPEHGVESPQVRSRLALLAPHATALLRRAPSESTAALAVRTARHVFESGDFAAALELAPGVVARSEEVLGNEHPLVLEARHVQALALYRMGDYAASEALERSVLERRELLLGPDHPDTLRSCLNLTWPLFLRERIEEAAQWAYRALEGQRRVLGEGSPETLSTWTYVIELMPYLEDGHEFELEAATLLRTCEQVFPPDHVTTMAARHSYAEGLRVLGRYVEAEPLAHRVLADRTRFQGPDHPLTLSALCLKARVERGLGRIDDAVVTLGEVIARRERVLGPEHPFVVENREWLAQWQVEAEA